jgi:Leucine-rich repeat (LRR) protein
VRFFKDRMFKPDDEKRGHHTLNALHLIAPRLPKIEGLSLDYFRLRTLDSVATFRNLKALSIAGCRTISDFSPLAELSSLEVLRLDDTRISDLSPLTKSSTSEVR